MFDFMMDVLMIKGAFCPFSKFIQKNSALVSQISFLTFSSLWVNV